MRKTTYDSDQFDESCPPAITDRQRENQLIALAEDQAERLMRSGKAPAAIITHYLKRATAKRQTGRKEIGIRDRASEDKEGGHGSSGT